MGTYTTNLKFYKPDPSEFVDVNVQINRNMDIADQAVRRCLEYEFTALPVPDVTDTVTPRARFFKQYSNSVMTYFKVTPQWYQDPTAYVGTWNPALSFFSEGYNFAPSGMEPYYRIFHSPGSSTTQVEWLGAFWELGNPMELNTNVTVIPIGGLPAEATPATSKYFDVWAGNTSSNFSMARILIGNDGRMEFKRYGANPSSGVSNENRVELTGIRYAAET